MHSILSMLLCVLITGCGQSGTVPPKTDIAKPKPTETAKPTSEPAAENAEQQDQGAKCPDHADVCDSLDEGQRLLAEAKAILRDNKNPDLRDRIDKVQTQLSSWQEHNRTVTENCSMLLGADGTSVFPEIPLAMENLTLGGMWMQKSMDAASKEQKRESGLYLRAAGQAITQASKVIDKKVKPNRRTAVMKTPSYLKSLEKQAAAASADK